jgi:hypothetical protein
MFFIATFLVAWSFPKGAREYPLLILGTGFVLAFFGILCGLQKNRKLAHDPKAQAEFVRESDAKRLTRDNILAIWITIVASGVYAGLMPFIGYFPSTFLFMVLLMSVLKNRFRWLYFFLATAFCALIYVVFVRFLHISLPDGWIAGLFYWVLP